MTRLSQMIDAAAATLATAGVAAPRTDAELLVMVEFDVHREGG